MKFPKRITISLIALLVANSITLIALLLGYFSEKELFITYIIEGAIICFYNYLKIANAEDLNLNKFFLSSFLGKEKNENRKNIITFFQLNYAIFMMANLTLLMVMLFTREVDFESYFYAGLLSISFLVSHGMSFRLNFFLEESNVTLNNLFFSPYKRFGIIIIALYIGFFLNSPAILLIFIKTLLDVFLHLWERKSLSKNHPLPEQTM